VAPGFPEPAQGIFSKGGDLVNQSCPPDIQIMIAAPETEVYRV